MGKGLTVVLIERKEQYSMLQPPTFPMCGMGGGKSKVGFTRALSVERLVHMMCKRM
jgi:hypothetical protein